MLAGVSGYLVYAAIPALQFTHGFANHAVGILQPLLIFAMLLLTFCRIDPRHLRFRPWHLWLILIQCGLFTAIGIVLIILPHSGLRVVLEGAMLCLICPTATAAAVITRKLGGNVGDITTYTILINIANAILIPVLVPFVHHNPDMDMMASGALILSKVFPLLLGPLAAAMLIRHIWPALHAKLADHQELSFYLWAVALALATAVTTRSIAHSTVAVSTQLWLVAVSFVTCILQFWAGRKIGAVYGERITAGQALGQKNTVLAIWFGYTFFTPVTSVTGGFYSIWHNIINSRQLYVHKHQASHGVTETASHKTSQKAIP